MRTNLRGRLMFRFFILFIVVTVLAFVFGDWLDAHKINHFVVLGANMVLLVLTGADSGRGVTGPYRGSGWPARR